MWNDVDSCSTGDGSDLLDSPNVRRSQVSFTSLVGTLNVYGSVPSEKFHHGGNFESSNISFEEVVDKMSQKTEIFERAGKENSR